MANKNNRKIQYLAALCAALAHMFTGATLSWASPVIPKFKSGEANVEISDSQISWVASLLALGALPGCHFGKLLSERFGSRRSVFGCVVPGFLGAYLVMAPLALISTSRRYLTAAISCIKINPSRILAKSRGDIFDAECTKLQLLLAFYGEVVSFNSIKSVFDHGLIFITRLPEVMYIGRFLVGTSTGMIAVVTMIYITEIADKQIRGSLGMLVQVMFNIGSLLVLGVGPFASYYVLNSIVLMIPICYMLACMWIPESPYHYLKTGRIAAAKKVFMKLKGTTDEKWADEQLSVIKNHITKSMENKTTFKELCTNKRYRKAIYIVVGLKVLQYMTGSLAIQSYLETIFRHSSSISGPLASTIYGFVQLIAGIGATFLARFFGRRILMLTSCLGVAISLTTVGVYFFLQDSEKVSHEILSSISAIPLVGILSFNIFYTVGLGILPYVMQVEFFPVNVKPIASSAATMTAAIFNFSVTKGYQNIKDLYGLYTVFWTFASVGYLGIFFIYFCVPETKGKTLEEVQDEMQNMPAEEQALKDDKALHDLADG